ncbi:MAG: PD-(D/E)XK nuclease-like domain-containing protein [Shewanella sp.]
MSAIITKAGAYPDIDMELYHRAPNLLPGPSLSSSGAKKITSQSAYHFWHDSPLNPERPPEAEKTHFNVGKAAHDMILLGDDWRKKYFVLPEGFRENATNKFASAIEELAAAREAGTPVLKFQEAKQVEAVSNAISANRDAVHALSAGVPEMTIVHKDEETGIWCRSRPDWLPYSVINGADVMVVTDLKFLAMTHCRPHGFSKALFDFGYHQSTAWYEDGIEAVYGRRPTNWLFIAVEKDAPHSVSVYELPRQDIERGRHQNKQAKRIFADCLASGKWPSYTTEEIQMIGLPVWARKAIDEYGGLSAAALVNSYEGAY